MIQLFDRKKIILNVHVYYGRAVFVDVMKNELDFSDILNFSNIALQTFKTFIHLLDIVKTARAIVEN